MKLTAAVCDDNKETLKSETELIRSIFDVKGVNYILKDFSSPYELLESDTIYDIVFLDIEMKGINGIELAARIREDNNKCFIFFITNYSLYLDSAFDINAFRFLCKPIDKTRLCSGIDRAIDRMRDEKLTINVTNFYNKCSASIGISSIIYIQTYERRTRIVSVDQDFVAVEPFSFLKAKIESEVDYFVQPHQSFFVNMRYVKEYSKSYVDLAFGKKMYRVDMSRRGYAEFDKKIFLIAGEMK